jgi:hypothetical protein
MDTHSHFPYSNRTTGRPPMREAFRSNGTAMASFVLLDRFWQPQGGEALVATQPMQDGQCGRAPPRDEARGGSRPQNPAIRQDR